MGDVFEADEIKPQSVCLFKKRSVTKANSFVSVSKLPFGVGDRRRKERDVKSMRRFVVERRHDV